MTAVLLAPPDVGPDPELLGAGEFMTRGGLTYRQLDHWTRRGILQEARPAAGSGSRRSYHVGELRVLAALRSLAALRPHLDGLVLVAALVRATPGPLWLRLGRDAHQGAPLLVSLAPYPAHDGALYLAVAP